MSGAAGVTVSALVLAALLVLRGSPGARLRAVRAIGTSRQADGAGRARPTGVRWRRLGRPHAGHRPDPAQTVSELAALLRAGVPPGRAFDQLAGDAPPGPWGGLLSAALAASRRGQDVPRAVRAAASACSDDGQRTAGAGLAATWQVAERTGAPMAHVLDRLAAGLRADEDARGAASAAMAGPRATARLLAWLPLGGLLLGQLIGADPFSVLVGTGLGRLTAMVGGALALAGWAWTRRLLRAAGAP